MDVLQTRMNQTDDLIASALMKIMMGEKPVFKNGNTILMMLCEQSKTKLSLDWIKTGKENLNHVNNLGETALLIACMRQMPEVALKLIQTGVSNYDNVNEFNKTALIFACESVMENVALAIISTGKCSLEIVGGKSQNTALIWACSNKMETVALKLLEVGNSNYLHRNQKGHNADFYAQQNGLTKVCKKIDELLHALVVKSSPPETTTVSPPETTTVSPPETTTVSPPETTTVSPSETTVSPPEMVLVSFTERAKCAYCQKPLVKPTHCLLPCGHTEYHLECLISGTLGTQNIPKKCYICNVDIVKIVRLM